MKPLFTEAQYTKLKSENKLPCECYVCQETFYVMKKNITYEMKMNRNRLKYCSLKCRNIGRDVTVDCSCDSCGINFQKPLNQVKRSKTGNHFCSRSCAATYNNTHKKHGTRKSKLEVWLEAKLTEMYSDLEFHFNRKDTINSELDIYIPSMKLGFELNGIYHYEPIHGGDKLSQIQNNDNRKFQACLEQGIELCIIDTSQQKYFKEKTSQKYFDIIINILNQRTPLNS